MSKRVVWLLLSLSLLLLSACDYREHDTPEVAGQNLSLTVKIHHLHMLINHSLQMAAQGADMNLMGIKHGPAMLDKASDLLNRAMSGPEMAGMHKTGGANAPLMTMTHDLAAKTAELITVMKALTPDSSDKPARFMLHHSIEVAATGNSLIMQGQQGMAGDVDAVMVNHGQVMLGEASGILHGVTAGGDYKVLVSDVVSMLIGIPEMPHDELE